MLHFASFVVYISEDNDREVFLMRKIVGTGIVLFLLLFSAIPASAANPIAESEVTPQFTAIMHMSAGLSIDSWGKTTCSGSVTPQSNSYTSNLTVTLQKYTSNGWSNIKSWSVSGEGFIGANFEGYYYITSGTYRVRSTASIYNSSGVLLEAESFYSDERIY
jgi:hypothetical protein